MEDLKLPDINYGALSPMLILFGAACLGILLEAVLPRSRRNGIQLTVALLALTASLVAIILGRNTRVVPIGGAVAVDGPALFLQGSIVLLGIVSLLLIGERAVEAGGAF